VAKGTSYVAAVIELDDKTHLLPARRKRDKFLDDACKRAGLPLIRFKTARRYDVGALQKTIKAHLPSGATEVRPNDPPGKNAEGQTLGWIWKRIR
jgi:very-short-patch-repair endonuclease